MEAMFNEVKKELEEESRKKTRSSRRSYSKRQISSLSSGPELAEYLEAALDPSIIQVIPIIALIFPEFFLDKL